MEQKNLTNRIAEEMDPWASTALELPSDFAQYIPEEKRLAAIRNAIETIVRQNEDDLDIKRLSSGYLEASNSGDLERILSQMQEKNSGESKSLSPEKIYQQVYKSNLDSQRSSIENGLVATGFNFFVPDPQKNIKSSKEAAEALTASIKKDEQKTREDLENRVSNSKEEYRRQEAQRMLDELESKTTDALGRVNAIPNKDNSVSVTTISEQKKVAVEGVADTSDKVAAEFTSNPSIPENIIGERRDIGENIAATEAALREEGRAEILAYKKTLEPEEKNEVGPENKTEGDSVIDASSKEDTILAPELKTSSVDVTTPENSPVVSNIKTQQTSSNPSLEVKLQEKNEKNPVPNWRKIQVEFSINEKINNLENQLNSKDVPEAQKGAIEEERDALKKELDNLYKDTESEVGVETKTVSQEESTVAPQSWDEIKANISSGLEDLSTKSVSEQRENSELSVVEMDRAEELGKIEDAISSVASGEKTDATIEVSADAFSEYGADLRNKLAYMSGRYGAKKETKKLEKELAAYEKKEASALQVRESFEFAQQKLEDPTLDPETRAKLERNKATLEKISQRLEAKRQSQDRKFREKSLDWAKENIAGKWIKSKWYTKIGIGAGLSMLTLGASQFVTRPLGLYAGYQGLKEGKISKLTDKIKGLEDSGKSDEAKDLEIEKTILEYSLDKKSLAGALALAAAFGALGEYISETETLKNATDYVSDKFSEGVDILQNEFSELTGESVVPLTGVAAAAAEGASTIHEHSTVTVESGDTMYSILEKEFNISEKLPEEGRQYNAIENILAQIKANPAEYGITSGDVNKLAIGDTINIEKIGEIVANHKIAGEGIFEHAKSLPPQVVSGIENYMPTDAKEAFTNIRAEKVVSAVVVNRAESVTSSAVDMFGASTGGVSAREDMGNPIGSSILTGETTLEALAAEDAASGTVTQPANIETNFVAPEVEPAAPAVPEIGIIPAAFSMTETESLRGASLLMADMSRLGGNWSDVTRFGAEPIATFVSNPPAGSEKVMSLLQNYRGTVAIAANEQGTVLQYLQRAALTSVRSSNIA